MKIPCNIHEDYPTSLWGGQHQGLCGDLGKNICQCPKMFDVKTSWLTLRHPYYCISIHSKQNYRNIATLVIHSHITFSVSKVLQMFLVQTNSLLAKPFQTLIIFIWRVSYKQHTSVNSCLSSCCTEVRVMAVGMQTLCPIHNFTVQKHLLEICKMS